MKFFIDTANVDEIKEAASYGMVDGVTTNPSLIAKEKKSWKKILPEICEVVKGPVSAEVVSVNSPEKMIAEGKELHEIAENIVVKIPLTMKGIKAVRQLESEGIRTNVTLCFSATQALLVYKAGAGYVSPFLGRLDDIAHDGMDLIRQCLDIAENYGYTTEIIAASIRHPLHVVDAARIGAHIATIPFKVIMQLVKHPLTDLGMERFEADWKAAGGEPILQ